MKTKVLLLLLALTSLDTALIIHDTEWTPVDFDEENQPFNFPSLRILKDKNASSANLHKFFDKLKNDRRKLMGAPDSTAIITNKIGKAFGGTMSVKMPDNPSPIFVNQNPFYAFR